MCTSNRSRIPSHLRPLTRNHWPSLLLLLRSRRPSLRSLWRSYALALWLLSCRSCRTLSLRCSLTSPAFDALLLSLLPSLLLLNTLLLTPIISATTLYLLGAANRF